MAVPPLDRTDDGTEKPTLPVIVILPALDVVLDSCPALPSQLEACAVGSGDANLKLKKEPSELEGAHQIERGRFVRQPSP
jgi:hypothetical protein